MSEKKHEHEHSHKHADKPVEIPAHEAKRVTHHEPLHPTPKPAEPKTVAPKVAPKASEPAFKAETTAAPPGEPAFPAETTDDGTLKGVDTPVEPLPRLPTIKKYQQQPVTVEVVEFNGQNLEECKVFCPQIANEADGCLSIPLPKEPPLAGHVRVGDYIVKPTGSDHFYVVTRDELKGSYKKLP